MSLVISIAALGTTLILFRMRRVMGELAQSEAKARHLASFDHLSGLANRLHFSEVLEQRLRARSGTGHKLALICLDLDRFKMVNDTFGHDHGDLLIKAVAERISVLLGPRDVLARFGGDEFAVLVDDLASTADARAFCDRVLLAMRAPFTLGVRQIFAQLSVGGAMAPDDANTVPELLRLADLALYRAKSGGRDRAVMFTTDMTDDLRLSQAIEADLRLAIDNGGIEVHYQPLFSGDGRRIVALEALARWNHPTLGQIPPGKFIPLAEERGLIKPLGEHVMRVACRDAMRWPDIRMAVNVSAIQFRYPGFAGIVADILAETGLDPKRLEIEITESVMLDHGDAAQEAIRALRATGVRIALDDFGTGFASLTYLRRFAIDKIKIDRSFLDSLEVSGESTIILHSIVHLGRALGLTVTAEGVESIDQHRILQALGCQELQGYLFARPACADAVNERITHRAAKLAVVAA
jgi:diguanylate cyclase (GGDEF)-like protein